ncbi:regulatory protein TraE1 [Enterococcus faecium]|nr:regulatory protein TraE1 [Enterococcus faecium]
MSYTGILSLKDICHYGKRCTATEKITKKISTGQSKTVVQCKKYIIQKDKVSEEMIITLGNKSK